MSSKEFDREDLTNMLLNSAKGSDLSNIHSPLFQNIKLLKKESEYLLNSCASDANHLANEKDYSKLKGIGFFDNDNNLTFIGRINAIRLLSLEDQCDILGIQKKTLNKETYTHPEYVVINHFEKNGWLGRHCEGDIIFDLISCSLINILEPLFYKAFGTTEKFKSYIPYINPFKTYTAEVIQETLAFTLVLTPETVIKTFIKYPEYFSFKQWLVNPENISSTDFNKYVKYNINHLSYFLSGIGNKDLTRLADLCLNEKIPRKGWPDLILVYNKMYRFIEVKSKDKLHLSQIITLQILKENNFEIEINQVN